MPFIDKFTSMFYRNQPESNEVTFKENATNEEKWRAYFYESTYDRNKGIGCLKNLKGIRNESKLGKFEKIQTATNSAKLNKIEQTFDVEHIKSIHKTLFDGIYSWAGEFREVNMRKGNSDFLDYKKIPEVLKNVVADLENLDNAQNDPDKFSDELCKFYLKLNDVHAFREGNGRTQNKFIGQVCEKYGYTLDLQLIMENLKKERINYYALFSEYNRTKDHRIIKAYLFDRNLIKNEQVTDLSLDFKQNFSKKLEEIKQKTDSIKQQNYRINRVR